MPPVSIRRPLTVTAWLVVSAAGVVLSPLLLALGALMGALTGRREPMIAARLILAYFAHELAVLVACGALWIVTGAGRMIDAPRSQRLHWRLLRWYAAGLASAARSAIEIDVVPEASQEATRALESDAPLIVLSRHAGPGDTIFIADQLLSRFHRRPSVVFKETIAIDPCIDLLAHRLPHAMIDPSDREQCEARIAQITAGLGPRGTLLLFPEGGNFTPERRRSALRRLWRKGQRSSAERAEDMPHVLPPQPVGALAALRARPDADVVFSAHTGLGLAAYPRQIWREMPIGRTLHIRMWLAPREEVPVIPDEQVDWLYDWWKRIDGWIAAQQPGGGEGAPAEGDAPDG
ncbi:MAG: 1-acyl-sn-glycerol-3-phosphate acyltransferase [Solirubrobacterales bacterium]|nr:1-acyl-sn-glycerol-3-phosphate acyltransferase [Solirubrobacterales bacterium]MBV8948231.1 1-acyl-sn-glycerol-3-phosphate acyltransferase [Solirubrobacterales bacterium]